eukprot:SAG31_NODE_2532_length_5555_cov_2.362170_5_plen_74_part_00
MIDVYVRMQANYSRDALRENDCLMPLSRAVGRLTLGNTAASPCVAGGDSSVLGFSSLLAGCKIKEDIEFVGPL